MRRSTRASPHSTTWGVRCEWMVIGLEPSDRPGVAAGGKFYPFTDHFQRRRAELVHSRATDSRIQQVLEDSDFSEPREGNRQVSWKFFPERQWWIKVVLLYENHSPVILSAYEDTVRGQEKWQASQLR